MKISTPIGAACTLSDLKVWVEEVNPDIIAIPKGHTLTCIRQFNPWQHPQETWSIFRGIPILYGEKGDLVYDGALVRNETQ